MRYYRLNDEEGSRLVAATDEEQYDLTAVKPRVTDFRTLAAAAAVSGETIDDLADTLVAEAPTVPKAALDGLARPLVPDEVWAAGVTYQISEEAREQESGMPEMYLDVYNAERPEIFFKATASRTVGPGVDVGIRTDSDWDVPEPELGIVLYDGNVVGYTVGNDVSSRSIEGENPLYLPQAKVYDRCCSLGPCIASPGTVADPHDLEMTMSIVRNGERVYSGRTSTSEMARTCDELIEYWSAHNAVPELAVLLTGTPLVPDDDFTLRPSDTVHIDIEGIGELTNTVRTV